jgi:hypothetical protein
VSECGGVEPPPESLTRVLLRASQLDSIQLFQSALLQRTRLRSRLRLQRWTREDSIQNDPASASSAT